AVDWLLRHWGEDPSLCEIDADLASKKPSTDRRWYVNGRRQTMAVLQRPSEFTMGSLYNEIYRYKPETPHTTRIPRSFAIATKEVTLSEFKEFLDANPAVSSECLEFSEVDGPVMGVTWCEAAQYCRWLSQEEGIPQDQMCYPSVQEIQESIKQGRI